MLARSLLNRIVSCVLGPLLFMTFHGVGGSETNPGIQESLLLKPKAGPVLALSFSLDGKTLASGSDNGEVHIWKTAIAGEVVKLTRHKNGARSVQFSSDGKTLISEGGDGVQRVWLTSNWVSLSETKVALTSGKQVVCSLDGTLSATYDENGVIRVSYGQDATRTKILGFDRGNITAIAFSPDNGYLASASSNAGFPKDANRFVKIWNLATSELLTNLPATANKPRSVAFSPDGRFLACGGNDGAIKLWEIVPPLSPKPPVSRPSVVKEPSPEDPRPSMLWEPSNRRKVWVLAVGVGQYKHSSIPPLPFARQDAERIRDWVLQLETDHVTRDNVRVLFDEQFSRENFLAQIDWLRKEAMPEDAVFVYFAGHGAPELEQDGKGVDAKYLLLYDTDPNELFKTGLSLDELTQKLDYVKAKVQVVILEACYTGPVGLEILKKTPTADLEIRPRLIQEMGKRGGRVILSASSGRQVAIGSDEIKGGLFTHYLLSAWGDGSRPLLSDCFDDVREQVRRAANRLGSTQEPARYGDQNLDVVLTPK